MSLDDFNKLEKWVKRHHPEEKLKYWSYAQKEGEVEFYCRHRVSSQQC
jgi:hypothetical protein